MKKEKLENELQKDLDLILSRVGHQIYIHRSWILKQPEEEIIKFVKAMAYGIMDRTKVLKSLLKETEENE